MHISHHVFPDLFTLGHTIVYGRPVVNAAVHAADRGFGAGFQERVEVPRIQTEFFFHIVVVREIVAENGGQRRGGSPGDHAVPAGVFRERRRLQSGQPVLVDIAVDDGFRPDQVAPVFFIPAADERVEQGDGSKGVRLGAF